MHILTLDGGGSKGVYTLGILKELELMLGAPLHEKFNFIYGTSTGAIIASLLALGYPVQEIEDLYFKMIPRIMKNSSARGKTASLKYHLQQVLGNKDFTHFKTGIGIVATSSDNEKPFVFKDSVDRAYKLKQSFEPGFGSTIADAVLASSAAYPIFEKANVSTKNQGDVLALDGGFIANNPVLFAIADVLNALHTNINDVKFLSLGTGNFVEKIVGIKNKFYKSLKFVQLFEKILRANANTTDVLTNLLFKDLDWVRINESFNQPEYATSMVESDVKKLRLLHTLGRNSFASHEEKIKKQFGL